MIDTANLAEIKEAVSLYPITGVTTNPSILKREGQIKLYSHLDKIAGLCAGRSLHVQVVSDDTAGIIEEAHVILDRLGRETYIKIPVSTAGLPAIKALASEGVHITATAVSSAGQGILAVLAGAEYIALYFNRMENAGADPESALRDIRSFIDGSGSSAKILAASFKNAGQLTRAFSAGAHGATVGVDIIKSILSQPAVGAAVEGFRRDFESVHGTGSTMKTVIE